MRTCGSRSQHGRTFAIPGASIPTLCENLMEPTVRSARTGLDLDLVVCPECGAPAEVEWRQMAQSTDGPVEHMKIRCLHRHWFLLPSASVDPG
jgi:hypothetical protein